MVQRLYSSFDVGVAGCAAPPVGDGPPARAAGMVPVLLPHQTPPLSSPHLCPAVSRAERLLEAGLAFGAGGKAQDVQLLPPKAEVPGDSADMGTGCGLGRWLRQGWTPRNPEAVRERGAQSLMGTSPPPPPSSAGHLPGRAGWDGMPRLQSRPYQLRQHLLQLVHVHTG